MAVGKAVLDLIRKWRPAELPYVLLSPDKGIGPRVKLGSSWAIVRAADVALSSLLNETAAASHWKDVEAAREGDKQAIARLQEYEKAIELPKDEEAIPQRLAWQIIQQISGLDIAHLMGKKLVIEGHKITVIDPRPNNFTFEIEVEATTEAFHNFKLEKIPSRAKLTARIDSDWILLTNPEGGTHRHNLNHENFSGKWAFSYFEPAGHSGWGEEVEYLRNNATCEVKDLNLKQIVAGLLKEIVDNGYLLGSQGR